MTDKIVAKISLLESDQQTETTSFIIHLSYDKNKIWTIERTVEDFRNLDKDFQFLHKESVKCLPLEGIIESVELEEYLNQVLMVGRKNYWQTDSLFSFLDNGYEKSIIRDVQIKSMGEKIVALDEKCTVNESKRILVEQQLAEMIQIVNTLQDKVSSLNQNSTSSNEKNSNVSSSNVSEQGQGGSTTTQEESSSNSSTIDDNSPRDNSNNNDKPQKAKMSSLERSSSENSMTLPKMNVNAPEWAPPDKMGEASKESNLTQDDAVDALIHKLQPHEAQLEYRSSVIELVRKQVRLALQANAMEVGIHVLRCFLPSDPIRLCVMMNRKAVSGWQTALFERLNIVSEKFNHAPSLPEATPPSAVGGDVSAEDQETVSVLNDVDDAASTASIKDEIASQDPTAVTSVSSAVEVPLHSFGNVDFAGDDQQGFRVTCTLDDGALDMEITANNRADLCMLAFLEDVAGLVGHNHLFKRSLLLIRAWWVYETVPYVNSAVSLYLSDFALSVMVCAVFNQHAANLSTPFQALWCFLREYDGYDGTTMAITLQGIVPFVSDNSNQPCVVAPHEGHLISAQMVDKYRQLFSIGSEGVLGGPTMGGGPQSMYDSRQGGGGMGGGGVGGYGGGMNSNMMYGANKVMGAGTGSGTFNNSRRYAQQQQQQEQYSLLFERHGYNIVHPFSCSNMVTDSMNARRIALVSKVFRIGKANLSHAMQQHNKNSFDLVAQYFPVSSQKFNPQSAPDDLRRDVFEKVRKEGLLENAPHWDSPKSLFNVAVDKIWKNIFYCNFIIESVLSESALLTVSVEALTEQGPLPAGEVGKLLTALSGIPNLSLKLKEKFGGLKKFLERFPDVFVFSTEHPFNPHVVLRHSMSKEQMDQMNRGIFPVELLSKQRKTVLASKVFAKSQEASGYGEDGAGGMMSHDHLAAVAMQLDDDMVTGGAAAYMSQYPPAPTAPTHAPHLSGGDGEFSQRLQSGGGGFGGGMGGGQMRAAQMQQQQQYRGGMDAESEEGDYYGQGAQGRAQGGQYAGQNVVAGINNRFGGGYATPGSGGGSGGGRQQQQYEGDMDGVNNSGYQDGALYPRGQITGAGQGISLAGLTGNSNSVLGGGQGRPSQSQQVYAPQQRMNSGPAGGASGFARQQGFQEQPMRRPTPPQPMYQQQQTQQTQPSLFQMQQHQMQQQQQGFRPSAPPSGGYSPQNTSNNQQQQGYFSGQQQQQQQRAVSSSIPVFKVDEYGRKVAVGGHGQQQSGGGGGGGLYDLYDGQGYDSDN